jgi:hypothetical protein
VSLDPRIENGTFNIEENTHMDILREYLIKKGIKESVVNEFCNLVLDGKFPERQAYNSKGILVTFPTPEYKANAIQKGTHFEKDPTKAAPNVFGPAPAQPGQPVAQSPGPPGSSTAPTDSTSGQPEQKTSLPLSQASAASPPTDPKAPPTATTAAPQASPETPSAEPAPEPNELPPPEPKSPEEKSAEKQTIQQMLKGDDYMLEGQGVDRNVVELYESSNAALHIMMLFLQGALPKKNEVESVAKRLQKAISNNSNLRL